MQARSFFIALGIALIALAPVGVVAFVALQGDLLGFNDLWGPLALVFIAELAGALMCIPGFVRRPRSALAIVTAILGTCGALLSGAASAFCFVAAIAMGFN